MISKLKQKFLRWLAGELKPYLWDTKDALELNLAKSYKSKTSLPPEPEQVPRWTEAEIEEWKTMVNQTADHIKQVIRERNSVG